MKLPPPLPSHSSPVLLRRSFAAVIDYGLPTIASFFWGLSFASPNADGELTVTGLPALAAILGILTWLIVPEFLFGRGPGKWLLRLAVVNSRGDTPSPGQSLKRHLLDPFDFLFGPLPAVAIVATTPSRQRLGDQWAHTWVVPVPRRSTAPMPNPGMQRTRYARR
jgi:uncharacterized RDD family membrane protein YckC